MTLKERADLTVNRTPNPDCPACQVKRLHKPDEWKEYHPRAGEGVDIRDSRKATGKS